MDYLNSYRIEHAKTKLKDSNLSVNEISYSVGFQDARYFSKLFKKYVGITPKDYRKIYS
ncbi:MAG: helix-turn-helix domain-containing protein [Enterocloster bolteae]